MTDFLLELRSEEIPARMQDKARDDLERLFAAEIGKAGLVAESVTTYATPRRLALIARGLPVETAAVAEEFKGPRTSAPAQALEGFLRKTGLAQDQLEDRDGVWFAVVEKAGRAAADVLAEAVPAIVRAFPWPKSMRWGAASSTTESLRWVRPLQGIVAILGEALVPCAVDGVESGFATRGHRFHHKGEITIGGADDYVETLRAAHVIVDQDERRGIIRDRAAALCAERGLAWISDEALVAENAGLTEWPVPLLGDFDPAFLEVPPEVVRLTLGVNQKYFVCSKGGSLAPAFICTANIEATDGGAAIVAGNRKVLAARLSDARFFWEQDKKTPLAVHAEKLSRITFHEKLGTVADKVERVAKLARWLVEEGIVTCSPAKAGAHHPVSPDNAVFAATPGDGPLPSQGNTELADLAETAARLCKADLVTEMVGEFPELQGVMGGYYARAEGLPDAVADAIRDHYKPVGAGDAVPTAPVTVAVSLADKLDTLLCFFAVGERPTGSKDPFALRRAALGILALMPSNARFDIATIVQQHRIWMIQGLEPRMRSYRKQSVDARAYQYTQIQNLFGNEGWMFEVDEMGEDLAIDDLRTKLPSAIKIQNIFDQTADVFGFMVDRLKVQQREAGVRHDLIDAVFALGGEDDLVRLLARVKALQAFVGTADGVNLLAGYKRAANILKKEGGAASSQPCSPAKAGVHHPGSPDKAGLAATSGDGPLPSQGNTDYVAEPAEAALIAALDVAEPAAASAVAGERFEEAMAALASLRAPIDAFFESVTVNDADPAKRAARLGLLARLTAAVNGIADFSKIEG